MPKRIIRTAELSPTSSVLQSVQASLWIYNGLDCCVTHEVNERLEEQLDPTSAKTYAFTKAMQGPALDMMQRGILVDVAKKQEVLADLTEQRQRVLQIFHRYTEAILGTALNPASPAQLVRLFYEVMGIPTIYAYTSGTMRPSMNREALEKLQAYFYARPISLAILTIRDLDKKIGVLKTGIDADNRMRTSYNITGTETGRWSSSSSAFGTGTNQQNITDELRGIFTADPGMKFAYLDLEQAESRIVGLLSWLISGQDNYLRACESGDLHTSVARMVWPNLGWTENPSTNKEVAGQLFYRQFSYRYMAKRGGHGTNYIGQPTTMARHLKIETKIMEDFQYNYFLAFPEIRGYHHWIAQQVQIFGQIKTILGRRRFFFGRPDDMATIREAVAFMPQSTVADILNIGLFRLWRMIRDLKAELLGQVHDAVLVQYREEDEAWVIQSFIDALRVPFTIFNRDFVIPVEAQIGWNWAHFDPAKNPGGLKTWEGKVDVRQRPEVKAVPLLDRRIC